MRKLSDNFFNCLKDGFLSSITEAVNNDLDLNLEIRNSYINVYYKGNSLLKLTETGSSHYKAEIHKKFLEGLNISLNIDENTIAEFINSIPLLKQNIVRHGKRSIEIEYEQMIIRANNNETRSNTEYFIIDRQYVYKKGRLDLTGIFWDSRQRRKYQEVPVCLMEIKYALNSDIKKVGDQLTRYYDAIKPHAEEFADEMQTVFRQKLDLGLYHQQSQERVAALKTLVFLKSIEQFQFILILVDYNPNSGQLNLQALQNIPFSNQIKIFYSGFAMWKQNVKPLHCVLSK